jgi:hypothetical protein
VEPGTSQSLVRYAKFYGIKLAQMLQHKNLVLVVLTVGLFCLNANSQNALRDRYKCRFVDTLTLEVPDETYRSLAVQALQGKEVPDSVLEELTIKLKTSIVFSMPMQLQKRDVEANADSTTILISEVQHKGVTVPLTFNKLKLRNGREIMSASNEHNEPVDLSNIKERNFISTGQSKVILGFNCKEFATSDGDIAIWVTNALPSWINPGVANVNVAGAILRFRLKTYGSTLISTVKSID